MELLYDIILQPFVDIVTEPVFFIEVVVGGVLTGVMYSLVALGFVLIFKASGVFNFAQGIMVLFAALTLGRADGARGAGVVGADRHHYRDDRIGDADRALGVKPLVNQADIILFMATIGLTFFLQGLGEMMWGANVKELNVGLPDESFEIGGVLLNEFDLSAAVIAAVLVAVLAVVFQRTKIGRALRAVADDHQAALSIGISLTHHLDHRLVGGSGIVALVAGIMWGSKIRRAVFSLSLIALKALPVLILGGFTSIPGAIIGGLIIGVGEKLAEIYLGSPGHWWRDRETGFAYMLIAVVFLMVPAPGACSAKSIIERV